eukprot:COSAG05_NODE_977_length_6332_cov_10.027755_3_plen_75_part_00
MIMHDCEQKVLCVHAGVFAHLQLAHIKAVVRPRQLTVQAADRGRLLRLHARKHVPRLRRVHACHRRVAQAVAAE